MTADPTRRFQAVTLQQAAEASPTLANLAALARDSAQRLKEVEPLIPPPLRAAIQAGPIEDGTWCLLVSGSAAAAKLRQLLPALQAHLRACGRPVQAIRIRLRT